MKLLNINRCLFIVATFFLQSFICVNINVHIKSSYQNSIVEERAFTTPVSEGDLCLKTMNNDLSVNSELRAVFAANPDSAPIAWRIAYENGDQIRTNAQFINNLADDIANPQFPTGSSATADQLVVSLKNNNNVFNFYKILNETSALGNTMWRRYLEALSLPDASSRINILEEVLNLKNEIRQLNVLNNSLMSNLGKSNLAVGTANFLKLDGTPGKIDFISVSGLEPCETLLTYFTNINGKVIVPKGGSFSQRFFHWTDMLRAQDTEAKIIEYILDQVASIREISIPSGLKPFYVDDVLNGSNLEIIIRSEMDACSSCATIIKDFNDASPIPINFSGGTKYYDQFAD